VSGTARAEGSTLQERGLGTLLCEADGGGHSPLPEPPIEAAQVIEEMIALAREMRAANARGEPLGLSEEELAFYDALETSDSAVKILGDETSRTIARDLVKTVSNNISIDRTMQESVRANMRVMTKRILRKYGYPPDKQEKATQTVLEQAEALTEEWIEEGLS